MDFALSEDQLFFQESLKKYLKSMNHTAIARDYINGNFSSSQKAWRDLSGLGYLGINIPEQFTGIGEGMLSMVPVFEEIGKSLVPGPYAETLGIAIPILLKYGTEEQKMKYLPRIVSGENIFTFACLESSDSAFYANGVQMKAEKTDENYVLNGKKTLVPYVEMATNLLVAVRSNSDLELGISLLIVDLEEGPFKIRKMENFDEARSLSEITFDDVKVPREQLLGSEDEGWTVLEGAFDHLNVILSATMVGGMESLVEMAAEYANTREQFGRKIGSFQAIKHKVVDIKRELENARSLTYYAAWALDNNAEDKDAAISSARAYATESFIRSAGKNVHIHGGIGVTSELDSHLYLKRARSYENYAGSPSDFLVRIGTML